MIRKGVKLAGVDYISKNEGDGAHCYAPFFISKNFKIYFFGNQLVATLFGSISQNISVLYLENRK
ncbi:hypothetical protein FHS68_004423 [Dyadobacter arcticus]|uniref:Uncharacterized protein n=1 Tax=Dyadobacter arcticus TaxID=1078754 RepID=A0ABX0UQF9_9BACT|nr:hypothetical protein [Dyadobacter arcticus]